MKAWFAAAILCLLWAVDAQADPPIIGADIVIMGEVHDNPHHHANQAAWLARLSPVAVVFEMLSQEKADAAQAARPQGTGAISDATDWRNSGWPDFALYAPVFLATGDAQILGADVTRSDLRRAMESGALSVMADGGKAFALDVSLSSEQQSAREKMQADAHCGALPAVVLPKMVEAQRLRDATLAQAVVFAVSTMGTPVAVITGNGHARTDWGVPDMLRAALPDARVLSIGQIEEGPTDATPPYDFRVVTPGVRRDDPCAVFR